MTEAPTKSKLELRIEERRRKATEAAAPAPAADFEDVIPDHEYQASDEDRALDEVINKIGILEAYQRWCGKMVPEVGSKTESIMISCPTPGHRDSNPSAWLNTDKNTWYCGTCQEGGDVLDIAAFYFNYPVPGYKSGARFHDLRREMAASMGYTFVKPPGAKAPVVQEPEEILPPPTVEEHRAAAEEMEAVTSAGADVVSIDDDSFEAPKIIYPTLDWHEIVTPDTFLEAYMKACVVDDVAEEYHFWNGLVALGMAVGRDITLHDTVPVHGNLFLCLLGDTGDGKSRSANHLKNLLRMSMPVDRTDPSNKGVHIIGNPASAEVLIKSFMHAVEDPSDPKAAPIPVPVRGLIEFGELAGLTGRGSRAGNVLKPTLHDFYDASPLISSTSMNSGLKEAREAYASLLTTTQPKALKDLVSSADADSGFLNRWIFASGKAKKKIAIAGTRVDVAPAVPHLDAIRGWAGFGRILHWTEDANNRFTEFFENELESDKRKDENGLLTRIDLTLKKLVLLFSVNEMHNEVQVETVEKALAVYPYLIQAYGILSAQLGNDIGYQIRADVLYVAQSSKYAKVGVTERELKNRLQRKKYPFRDIKAVLEYMVDGGEIMAVKTKGTRGPETMRYRYVG